MVSLCRDKLSRADKLFFYVLTIFTIGPAYTRIIWLPSLINSRPSGVTPLATATRTVTATLPGDNDTPDPIDSALRIITETVTVTEAIETQYTLTTRVTVTLPAVIEATQTIIPTRTTTSTTTTRQAEQTPDNGQGRQDTAQAQETGIPFDYTCRPGDANEKYPGGLSIEATDNQRVTLCKQFFPLVCTDGTIAKKSRTFCPTDLIAIYIIGILIAWNLVGLMTLLYPVKMLVVAYHEFWHILVGVCLGQKLEKVDIAPDIGGKTVFNAPEPPNISLQPIPCYFVSVLPLAHHSDEADECPSFGGCSPLSS